MRALDIQIERGDLYYDIMRPVTDPKTGKRMAEVRASWTEGEEGVMCPIDDLAEILDANMAEDPEYYEGYPEAKEKAKDAGELDDDWIVQYFIDFVNDNAYEDPWDNPEIGNALSECWYRGRLRQEEARLKANGEDMGTRLSEDGKAFIYSCAECAIKAEELGLLSTEDFSEAMDAIDALRKAMNRIKRSA